MLIRVPALALLVFLGLEVDSLTAQLRPYEPFDWSLVEAAARGSAVFGSSILLDQRASLAGTQGTLAEFGNFTATARFERIMIEIGGTIHRDFWEASAFAPPSGGAIERPLGRRGDVGDYRIATSIILTGAGRPATTVLRFGSRLPTTDNTVGLDRDATDFFTTLGARIGWGPFHATGELGLGIHGTRLDTYEQSDLFLYMLTLTARTTRVMPSVLLLGQANLTAWEFRGTESLAEARIRLRSSGKVWIQAEAIRGLADFSPGLGASISMGGVF